MTDPKATLPNSYIIVEVEGTDVPMHQLADGRWVTTEERLRQEETTERFMRQFTNTGTDSVPQDHNPQTQGTLTRKPLPELEALVADARETKSHLDAYLGEMLGNPDAILAKDPVVLAHARAVWARPGLGRHAQGLIRVFRNEKWNKVRDVLNHTEESHP